MSTREELIKQFAAAEEREKKQKQEESEEKKIPLSSPSEEHGKSSKARKKARQRKKFFKTVRNVLTDKTLSKMLNVFLFCMIANVIEYFFLINYLGVPTKGVVSKIAGILIILGYMYSARLKPSNVGFNTNPKSVLSAVRNAGIANLAIIPAYILEFVYLLAKGHKPIIRIFAYEAVYSEVGPVYFIANILLLLVINTVSIVMLEVLFRGILIKMGRGKFGFWQTSIIISAFYSIWYLIIPLSKVTAGYKPMQLISLCIFYLIFEFCISIKWCMLTRATGSIWFALFDHLFFNILVGLIHLVSTAEELTNYIDINRNYRLIVIQLISFVFCFIYYKRKMHRKEQLLQKAGIRSLYVFDSLAEMSEEDVSRQAERIKTADGEIDAEYLRLLEKNQNNRHR